MEYNKLITLDLSDVGSLKVVYLKQYENKYTTLKFNNLDIKEGYEYFAVYRKVGTDKTYELPITGDELVLGTFITNFAGEYVLSVVAHNGSEEIVVIKAPVKVVVEKGVLTDEVEDVEFPEPLQSKYTELIALIEEVEGKLERGEFKGDTGNGIQYCTFSNYKLTLHFTDGTEYTTTSIRGAKGDKGDDYELTEADKEEIAGITEEAIKPTLEAKADKSELDLIKQSIPTKTSELANDSNFTNKAYVDEEIAKATPTDYEQVKEDIALLKWKTLNLATEVVDSTEAYSKAIPNSVYDKALLNRLGGKSEVANQLLDIVNGSGLTSGLDYNSFAIDGSVHIQGLALGNAFLSRGAYNFNGFKKGHKYYIKGCPSGGSNSTYSFRYNPNGFGQNGTPVIIECMDSASTSLSTIESYFPTLFVAKDLNVDLTFKPRIVDLTQRYGAGNEPTSVDDIRIKLLDKELEANPSYNEGSLVSASVESVVVEGKNLWDDNYFISLYPQNVIKNSDNSLNVTTTQKMYNDGYKLKETYYDVVSVKMKVRNLTATNTRIHFKLADGNIYKTSTYATNEWSEITLQDSNSIGIVGIVFDWSNSGTFEIKDVQIEKGQYSSYSPYHKDTKPITSIISKYFPNGMKSAQGVYDEFDLVSGEAIKRADSVDLGTFNWVTESTWGATTYFTSAMKTNHSNPFAQINPKGYRTTSESFATMPNKTLRGTTSNLGALAIRDDDYSNVDEFKTAMSGVSIYYALATPIITPIEAEDLEYLQSLNVESNGTITFEQLDTYMQVPNEESYLKRVE